jgi:acetone carboxylase gamma subunit
MAWVVPLGVAVCELQDTIVYTERVINPVQPGVFVVSLRKKFTTACFCCHQMSVL